MIRVEIDETIDRPMADVFEQLVDIAGYPEWLPERGVFVTCTQDTEGPVEVGTRYTDLTRLGPVKGKVVELERPRKVVFHYRLRLGRYTVMDGWPGYELEPGPGSSTQVHHVARGRLHGIFRLARPLVQRIADGERRRTVDALKASLEGAPG